MGIGLRFDPAFLGRMRLVVPLVVVVVGFLVLLRFEGPAGVDDSESAELPGLDPVATSEVAVVTTTTAQSLLAEGEGLSGARTVSGEWLGSVQPGGFLLLLEDGAGLAAIRETGEQGEYWDLSISPSFDALYVWRRNSVESGVNAGVVALGAYNDKSLVTVFGIVPLGTRSVEVVLAQGSLLDNVILETTQVFDRDLLGVAVFVGTLEQDVLQNTPPGQLTLVLPRLTGGFDVAAFPHQDQALTDGYTGPISTDMFLEP